MLTIKILPCVTIKKNSLHTSCIFTQYTHAYCEYETLVKKEEYVFPNLLQIYLIYSCFRKYCIFTLSTNADSENEIVCNY